MMRERWRVLSRQGPIAAGMAALAVLAALAVQRQRSDAALAERQERVLTFSSAEKDELCDRQKRFASFEHAEQERIRRLHAQLDADPQAAELYHVMENYYGWLKSIPPYQQAELRELPPASRVQRVKRILEEQSRKAKGAAGLILARHLLPGSGTFPAEPSRRLQPEDLEAMLQWIDEYAARHGTQFLDSVAPRQRQDLQRGLAQITDPLRRQEFLVALWIRWQLEHPGKMPPLSDQELADLRGKLSPETRKRLEGKSPKDQWRIISGLIPLFVLQQHAAGRPAVPFDEEELAQFFENEQALTSQQRDRLLSLPGPEMTRDLWRLYVRWKLDKLAARKGERGPAAKRPGSRGSFRPPRSGGGPAAKPLLKPADLP